MDYRNRIEHLKLAFKTTLGKVTIVLFLVITGGIFLQNYWYQMYAEKMEVIYGHQKDIANQMNLNVQLLNALHELMMPPNDILIHAANKSQVDNVNGALFIELENEKRNFVLATESLTSFTKKNATVLHTSFQDSIFIHLDDLQLKAKAIFNVAFHFWKTGEKHFYHKGTQLMEELDKDIKTFTDVIKNDSNQLLQKYQTINSHETLERKKNNSNRKRILLLVFSIMLFIGIVYLIRVGRHELLKQELEGQHEELSQAYSDTELLIEEVMNKNLLLQELSIKDSLTGLYNRRHFEELLEKEMYRMQRYENLSLCLMMIDIDFFKKVNDTYGHLIGDEVIKSVVALIQKKERLIDIAGRYGGEEFIVFLPETDQEGAMIKAERLRTEVEEQVLEIDDMEITLTISIGVSKYKSGMTVEQLTGDADKALYVAKNRGRNQVQFTE